VRALYSSVFLIAVLVASSAPCADVRFSLELTAAYTDVSYSGDAAWGWWNVGKYDVWQPSEVDEVGLVDVRLLFRGPTYTVFLAGEWYPSLQASASRTDPESGEEVHHELGADLEVYDLAIGQWFGPDDRAGVRPGVGLTYMGIDEGRNTVTDPLDAAALPADEARSRLWGVAIGADGGLEVASRLSVGGRVVIRWAEGTRKASFYPEGSDPGDPQVVRLEVSDSVSRTMFGAELGLRWEASPYVQLEGGWRYRDWQQDDGPASFNGPFVRLVVGM